MHSFERIHGVECIAQTQRKFQRADITKIMGRQGGKQGQANVGGRGAVCHTGRAGFPENDPEAASDPRGPQNARSKARSNGPAISACVPVEASVFERVVLRAG